MDLDFLEELFKDATKTPEGKIKIIAVPGFIQQLPAQIKERVIAQAEAHFWRKLTPQDLNVFYKEVLAPLSGDAIKSLLDWSREDGLLSRTEPLPQTDAKQAFYVEGGMEGPANPRGPEGQPGEMRVTVRQ